MTGPGRDLDKIRGQAHDDCQARRARVLAHPDLAAKLTRPPLEFAFPEAWNGYVPPRRLPEHDDPWHRGGPGPAAVNDSPRRAALIEICAEAARRANGNGPG